MMLRFGAESCGTRYNVYSKVPEKLMKYMQTKREMLSVGWRAIQCEEIVTQVYHNAYYAVARRRISLSTYQLLLLSRLEW